MTKYKLEFRHRPDCAEPIREKHSRFLAQLAGLGAPWSLVDTIELPDIEDELVVSVSLDKLLPSGVKGRISYALRNQHYLEDDAQFDDTLFIEFAGGKVDCPDLIKRVFPQYIKAFGAYRAALHDWRVTRSDWPMVVAACEATKKDVNGRDGVFRINAANYFDRELCSRAFGKSPKQIVDCLSNHVESVSEFDDGVLIVVRYSPMSANELTEVSKGLEEILS
jgi:hypothetical protein